MKPEACAIDQSQTESDPEQNWENSLRREFPQLNLVHEIEIRGAFCWETLAEASLCLRRFGAEPVSVSAQTYHEDVQLITCRIRALEDPILRRAVAALKELPGVNSILLSHHLGRASRTGSRVPEDRGRA